MKRYSCLCVSMFEKVSCLSVSMVLSGLLIVGLGPISTGIAIADEPILLTDSELDSIAGGFLEVDAAADAVALGRDSLTSTFTDTRVIQGVPQNDGYVYSQGTALADALAIGESVSTRTEVGFRTDEEVVSVQFQNVVETTIVGYVKPKDKKAWNQKKKSDRKKDKKAWNQKNKRNGKKDKKAWNQKKKNQPKKVRKNDPDKKAWHKKRHKSKRKSSHKKGHRNDPNKKAWHKKPIIQQRDVSTLVVITRVGVQPAQ